MYGVSYYQTISRCKVAARGDAPTLTLIKIFSIATNTKKDFGTAMNASKMLPLVCWNWFAADVRLLVSLGGASDIIRAA